MSREKTKVLIISHNPITDYNNMGKTFLSLFGEFNYEELCQFYIYPTLPNVKKCGSYFRVTDKDVFFNIFSLKKRGRHIESDEIQKDNTLYENSAEEKVYANKSSHKELKLYARHIIWKLGRWNTKKLKKWIEGEKPDVIFASAGQSAFFYDLILKISKTYKLPIVSYVCDDFYFSSESLNRKLIQKLYYPMLRKKIKKLMLASKNVVTICDSLSRAYENEFGCKTYTVCSGADIKRADIPVESDSNVLRYFGNIQLNRKQSLAEIGYAIDEVNIKYNTDFTLEIYSGDKIDEIFNDIKSVRWNGFVSNEKVGELMRSSKVLIHTESFDKECKERVLHSVSTKIADSLSSGVPLFAYGPSEIASMKHLIENDCAITACSKEELCNKLYGVLTDNELRKNVSLNGLKTAEKYHDKLKQSTMIKEIIKQSIERSCSKM